MTFAFQVFGHHPGEKNVDHRRDASMTFGNCRAVCQEPVNQTTAMASASAPDHQIIVVTPDMTELRQQCYDIRIAVFVSEQGKFIRRPRPVA